MDREMEESSIVQIEPVTAESVTLSTETVRYIEGDIVVIKGQEASWTIKRKTFEIERKPSSSDPVHRKSFEKEVKVGKIASQKACIRSLNSLPAELRDSSKPILLLALSAVGIVFGDIGASPLYTQITIFSFFEATEDNVIGSTSLLIWMLNAVVSLKYAIIMMNINNQGEGGVMALTALASRSLSEKSPRVLKSFVLFLGLFGTCMFFADSVITPSISVLSALEGLSIASPKLSGETMPVAVVVLFCLFAVQRFGSGRVGSCFGPLLTIFFITILVFGAKQLAQDTRIFKALNPACAVSFLVQTNAQGIMWKVIGATILGMTGAECLYADMGHFGAWPIRVAWFLLVMPCVVINYLGQGALLLQDPTKADNPFFHLFGPQYIIFAVVLATLATVIASQSVISGAFSMSCEAMKMGFLPQLTIRHTSESERGQVYLPAVNFVLMVAVLAMTVGCQSSANLADAFGMSVSFTMVITSLLCCVLGCCWCCNHHRPVLLVPIILLMGGILVMDIILAASSSSKFLTGAWIPMLIGMTLFLGLSTWYRGHAYLRAAIKTQQPPLSPFLEWIEVQNLQQVTRIGVYAVSDLATVPTALQLNLLHHQVLHKVIFIIKVAFTDKAREPEETRKTIKSLIPGMWDIELRYGYKEHPAIRSAISDLCEELHVHIDPKDVSYFIERPIVTPSCSGSMILRMFTLSYWQKLGFSLMTRFSFDAVDFYGIPRENTIEMGWKVEI